MLPKGPRATRDVRGSFLPGYDNSVPRADAHRSDPMNAHMVQRPSSPDEFVRWSSEATCGVFTQSTKAWYETSQNNLYAQVQEVPFFAELPETLKAIAEDYAKVYGASLFAFEREPTVRWHKKPYKSFVEKLFRINCLHNPNFPHPPEGGWISLDRSYESIDDIVRTTLVVAYADAPYLLAERLAAVAKQAGLACALKDHAQEKGYYAHHVYPKVTIPVASTLAASDYVDRDVAIEIQITTELQGALREITHRLYERERLAGGLEENWKSDFASGRFRAAYMAHSLRFIEAMIVDLRNNVNSADRT